MASIGGAVGGKRSKSKASSGTVYNSNFVNKFGENYGPGYTQSEVLNALPQTQNLFTGNNVGVGPALTPGGHTRSQTPASTGSEGVPVAGGVPGAESSVQQSLRQLGFGAAPERATAPTIGAVPQIGAPTAEAGQANIAPTGYEALQKSLYQQQYEPVARDIARQGAIQDRQLQAELAQRGLASSGAGVGQILRRRTEQAQQLQNASSDAINNAISQRYGLQAAQEQSNAAARTQVSLANAGFSLDAQKQNAANVLAGRTADADNYLKTIGLNAQVADQARSSFLQMLGLQETDLARLDKFQQDNLTLALNSWLQTFGAIAQASQKQVSSSKGAGAPPFAFKI